MRHWRPLRAALVASGLTLLKACDAACAHAGPASPPLPAIMPTRNLAQRIRATRAAVAALDCGSANATTPGGIRDQLAEAVALIDELRDEVFRLQEQNQQLRRDLADAVCPRLCAKPYRGAL